MSYCRFSDTSDVYVYGGMDGIVIHVASNRGTDKPHPDMKGWELSRITEWFNDHTISLDSLHAGASYSGLTEWEAVETLYNLRDAGLRVPSFAIERLLREVIWIYLNYTLREDEEDMIEREG